MSRRVYLDHNASTPVHPEVLAEMLPYFTEHLRQSLERPRLRPRGARGSRPGARARGAASCACAPEEIVFTSGGTESDNLAVKGLALAPRQRATSSPRRSSTTRCCARARRWRAQGFDRDLRRGGRARHGRSGRRASARSARTPSASASCTRTARSGPCSRWRPSARSRARTACRSTSTPCRPSASCRSTSTRSASTCCRSPAHKIYGPKGDRRPLDPQGHQDGLRAARGRARAAPPGGHRERGRVSSAWARRSRCAPATWRGGASA